MIAGCHDLTVIHGSGAGAVAALSNVELAIDVRDRLALLGRSGSGKTTLLHALGGLVEPTSGSVTWDGRPLATLDHSARSGVRARGIAYVFQSPNLLPYFTALENVRFGARGSGAADRPAAAELLALVGLTAKHDHLPAELSGGEQQRVAIARALGQQPRLLLCDEPTGHLDRDTGRRVLDLIDALQTRLGFALVIATHDGEVVARFDRRISLLDGRVVNPETNPS